MIVWQFATIAALIGALLIYVMVLTNRLGATNALLKRIEEGLVRPQPVTENAPVATRQVPAAAEPARARVVEAVPEVEVASVPAPVQVAPAMELAEETAAAEVLERDRRVSYLTVRDLKVISRSGRRSSDTPTAVSPLFNEIFGRKHGQAEPVEPPAETVHSSEANEEQTVPHLDLVATAEPVVVSVESHEAVVQELAAATYEIRDFLETTPALDIAVVEHEPVAFEPMTAEPNAVEATAVEPTAAEPTAAEPTAAEPTAAESVAAIIEAVEPSAALPANPSDIVAANEDQAPAAVPAAGATESEAADAAALEEKRRRDLLMQAQRRRRRLR